MNKLNILFYTILVCSPIYASTDSADFNLETQIDYAADLVNLGWDSELATEDIVLAREADADTLVQNSRDFGFDVSYNNASIIEFMQAADADATNAFFLEQAGGVANDDESHGQISLELTMFSVDDLNGLGNNDESGDGGTYDGGTITLPSSYGIDEQNIIMRVAINEPANVYNFNEGTWAESIFIKISESD
jgi:hypothetical protein